MSRWPTGSRPDAGSSSTSTSGEPSKRLGESQTLKHAAGELREHGLLPAVEPDAVQQLRSLLREFGATESREAAVEPHGLGCGQLCGKVGLLGQKAETGASPGRACGHAEHLESAPARLDEAE